MSSTVDSGGTNRNSTSLKQLMEDISTERKKDIHNKFIILQGASHWINLFMRHFISQSEPVRSVDSDDLLFFVRKQNIKSVSNTHKYENQVDVFRKGSRQLPIGDPDIDWKETVYLNMVIQKLHYTLTMAVCTRTSPTELQVLRRHSQQVYASPSRRKMNTKGEGEEMTYPHICFMVDNFDEVFRDIHVRDGEMVCVELVANDQNGFVHGVIFLGSIRYDTLKQVYDARQYSLSSKVAQRMSFGFFNNGLALQSRCEFFRMKGSYGKGHAEMALTKLKSYGEDTLTSELGFYVNNGLKDESDDIFKCRIQRRLSDPIANSNKFQKHSWLEQKPVQNLSALKAHSQDEGLDSMSIEISEIEAGDLTDELDDCLSNPLWISRGFTQKFYLWKQQRRLQSTPLNAFLTYVSVPWWSITNDLLEHREHPVLTFQ